MILIDRRDGSKELADPLEHVGLPVARPLPTLPFGDVAFVGRGLKGAPTDIGIEYKKIADLVACIRDGRFAGGQLPGMSQMYDRSWLLIEGLWRSDENGRITTYKGRYRGWQPFPGKMTAVEFEKHMLTFEVCGGISVRFVNTQKDTIRFIQSLYRWYTDKDLDQHTSHVAVYTPGNIVPLSDFRISVYRFPGIGLKTSGAVEQHFHGCLWDAVNAPVEEWASIEVTDRVGHKRKIGAVVAQQIVDFCRRRLPNVRTHSDRKTAKR